MPKPDVVPVEVRDPQIALILIPRGAMVPELRGMKAAREYASADNSDFHRRELETPQLLNVPPRSL
jgi:hypothetical protein